MEIQTQVCPIKANPRNVAGMIKEESFNCGIYKPRAAMRLSHMSKAPHSERSQYQKEERDVEKSLHDKTPISPGSSYA